MTASPSDTATVTLEQLAESLAAASGGTAQVAFRTAKVKIEPSRWVETCTRARDDFGLVFFSWLSAVDWSNSVEVGDGLGEEVEERLEVLVALSDLSAGNLVLISTDLPKDHPTLDTLVEVFSGANWHEREAHEMFGITFTGHPNLANLYLPDGFIGHPLRKSFPLLSREVKPWPGTVDVEGMPGQEDEGPSTENPEA
ncbi:MAG TPA: NADH-quinone oxidoreductase subunit C [Acidimicrobiia bacterium]|nr:NADH-quinone oxidoreductase subunit C [Acidimicrobiia bacterium]